MELWLVGWLIAGSACAAPRPTPPPAPPQHPGTSAASVDRQPDAAAAAACDGAAARAPLVFPDANQRPTYFTVHAIAEAHELSLGEGVRVGILDHGFGLQRHAELYAGSADFAGAAAISTLDEESHGYWMALTLREIAPKAAIYALNTASRDEAATVAAMVRAIDWAVEHDLKVLTYSSRSFAPEHRPRLDQAVERAIAQGVLTTFIHYPHPQNLLPSWLGGRSGDDEREPDVNILHYDYKVVFPEAYREYRATGRATGWPNYRPFLSMSSTSPVAAGIAALMLAVNPRLSPAECKSVMMNTARPMVFEGRKAPRVADARAAVEAARRAMSRRKLPAGTTERGGRLLDPYKAR